VTFLRLNRWNWLAFAAALALLLVMSSLWWTTHQAEQCRHNAAVQTAPSPGGVQNSEITRKLKSDARRCEAKYDKTAWSASAFIDRVILICLLVAIVAAVAAAFLRAADRRFTPPRSPSAIASVAGLVGALLILYRILQPPGLNAAAVIKSGAPIGLALVGILAIGARSAAVAEREAPPEPPAAAPESAAEPGPEPEPPADPAAA